jgi:hypothetical protein
MVQPEDSNLPSSSWYIDFNTKPRRLLDPTPFHKLTLPVKSFRTPTHSRGFVFTIFYIVEK